MTRLRSFVIGLALVVPTQSLAAELPPAIKSAGVLHLSVNAIYPPMEYKDPATGQLTGLDIDLGNAIAAKLGLKVEWAESAFEQLIPSLATGRTDFIISGLSDKLARQQVADFIDYLKTDGAFYTLSSSPAKTALDLCGKKVGTSRSTSFPSDIAAWSKVNCEAAGKSAIEVVPAESTADARGQLKQGRIDGAVQGSETISYVFGQDPGVFRQVGVIATGNPHFQGIAFKKDNRALRDAVAEVLAGLMKDGTYKTILTKYGLQDNAVAGIVTNGAKE
jgi:polar amino acid transport system substrate-binding protein